MNIIKRAQALCQGLDFYFTGKPCKNGHLAERRTSTGFCKVCAGLQYSKRLAADPTGIKERSAADNRRYRELHPDYFTQWWKNNKEKNGEYVRQDYAVAARRAWRQNNKGHQNFLTRMRQKGVKRATPPWADRDAIKAIYVAASERSLNEGTEYHVDHIIPLRGKLVCGLHTPANLQIIPKTDNLRKGNRVT